MAIAFDAVTDGGFGTVAGTTKTFAHTCTGSDRILFVATAGGSGFTDDITGVTYNTVAMTLVNKVKIPGDRYIYLWYLIAPATGSNNVVVTTSTSGGFVGASATSYTGAKQSGQPDANTTNTVTGNSLTGTLTTIADNCWTVLAGEQNGATPTAGTGSTLRTTSQNPELFDSNGAITPAGSTSMTITGSSGNGMALVMASFAPAVSASAQPAIFMG